MELITIDYSVLPLIQFWFAEYNDWGAKHIKGLAIFTAKPFFIAPVFLPCTTPKKKISRNTPLMMDDDVMALLPGEIVGIKGLVGPVSGRRTRGN